MTLSLASIEPLKVETPAVTIKPPVVALNPFPAVTTPTESILVTSILVTSKSAANVLTPAVTTRPPAVTLTPV